jgi:hypothetical protein
MDYLIISATAVAGGCVFGPHDYDGVWCAFVLPAARLDSQVTT